MLRFFIGFCLIIGAQTVLAEMKAPTLEVTALAPLEADLERTLITYRNDGLRLSALMVKPKNATRPLPVLIANHGFHPDPPHYGFVDQQRNERPGKYYGAIPAAFARRGYAVIMADYRGHNTSEGTEFTRLPNAPDLYATDVLALLKILQKIDGLLTDCVVVWGHSMGAHVSLRTALVDQNIRAISLWSLASPIKDWTPILDLGRSLAPIAIRHSIDDPVAPVANSHNLETSLRSRGATVETSFENSTLHYFEGALFERTIEADTRFFAAQLRNTRCIK